MKLIELHILQSMFSHARSTHKVDSDVVFWTAVDDHPDPGQEAGAGGMGRSEFNSGTYYRYAALNLDLLKKHLASMEQAELRSIVEAFVPSFGTTGSSGVEGRQFAPRRVNVRRASAPLVESAPAPSRPPT